MSHDDPLRQALEKALRDVVNNEFIRAVAALRQERQVCREQGGRSVIVSGTDADREYALETLISALSALLAGERRAPWRDEGELDCGQPASPPAPPVAGAQETNYFREGFHWDGHVYRCRSCGRQRTDQHATSCWLASSPAAPAPKGSHE